MKHFILFFSFLISLNGFGQQRYEDSIKTFLKNYVQNHEVVKGHDKDHMQFYEVNKAYRVVADFKPATSTSWITFKTSGAKPQVFKIYGTASFRLNNKPQKLTLYQSRETVGNEQYKNYLFLPFTDSTTGGETYISGRYLDLSTTDINNGKIALDFNKAYNPYCAYVSGVYNCPIPPKENALTVHVKAGEKTFSSSH